MHSSPQSNQTDGGGREENGGGVAGGPGLAAGRAWPGGPSTAGRSSPARKRLHTRMTHTLASRDRNEVQGLEVTDEINPTLTYSRLG